MCLSLMPLCGVTFYIAEAVFQCPKAGGLLLDFEARAGREHESFTLNFINMRHILRDIHPSRTSCSKYTLLSLKTCYSEHEVMKRTEYSTSVRSWSTKNKWTIKRRKDNAIIVVVQ